jgi:multiple sugar transport system permease protein/raffinose/stachyose/melibiose transport system permease protein
VKNNKFVAAALAPAFVLMFVFLVAPLFLGLIISLFDYNPLRGVNPFIGFTNFSKLLGDKTFTLALKNTLVFVFVTVTLNVVLTLLTAAVISGLKQRLRGFFRVVFFMPCVAPLVAASVVWGSLYSLKYGLINFLLKNWFGIAPHNWLGSPDTLMPAIILFTLWADVGYNIIIFSAGIDGIPGDFYESAAIDGAGAVRRFFRITLPLLARTFSFVVIMTMISHFQMFAQFEILTRSGASSTGGPGGAGMVMTLYIYRTAFRNKDMGYASAMAFALFLIIMAFTAVSRRLSKADWGY